MFIKTLIRDRVYSLLALLVVVSIVAAIIFPGTFPTFSNVSQLLVNLSIDTIVAVGMMILLISGVFDLSVGSIVAFTGCLTAYLMEFYGLPVPIALVVGLCSALAIGCLN